MYVLHGEGEVNEKREEYKPFMDQIKDFGLTSMCKNDNDETVFTQSINKTREYLDDYCQRWSGFVS